MKNITTEQKITCVHKSFVDFTTDVKLATKNKVEVSCDCDGIYFDSKEYSLQEVYALLSCYYDIDIISIHVDDTDDIGVWIAYKRY